MPSKLKVFNVAVVVSVEAPNVVVDISNAVPVPTASVPNVPVVAYKDTVISPVGEPSFAK